MIKKDTSFQTFSHVFMAILTILSIAPFILLIVSSFTDEQTLMLHGYSFFPAKWSLSAYLYLLQKSKAIVRAYGISFLTTFVGTFASIVITTLFAYPLSRKDLPGRKFFSFFLYFTMLFNGGLVPSYIMWTRGFHIQNTLYAYLIPNLLMSAYNVIMMRTYFTSNIPDAVIDAARIDGAREMTILTRVVIPMAKPIISTIILLVGLAYWNNWTNGL